MKEPATGRLEFISVAESDHGVTPKSLSSWIR